MKKMLQLFVRLFFLTQQMTLVYHFRVRYLSIIALKGQLEKAEH